MGGQNGLNHLLVPHGSKALHQNSADKRPSKLARHQQPAQGNLDRRLSVVENGSSTERAAAQKSTPPICPDGIGSSTVFTSETHTPARCRIHLQASADAAVNCQACELANADRRIELCRKAVEQAEACLSNVQGWGSQDGTAAMDTSCVVAAASRDSCMEEGTAMVSQIVEFADPSDMFNERSCPLDAAERDPLSGRAVMLSDVGGKRTPRAGSQVEDCSISVAVKVPQCIGSVPFNRALPQDDLSVAMIIGCNRWQAGCAGWEALQCTAPSARETLARAQDVASSGIYVRLVTVVGKGAHGGYWEGVSEEEQTMMLQQLERDSVEASMARAELTKEYAERYQVHAAELAKQGEIGAPLPLSTLRPPELLLSQVAAKEMVDPELWHFKVSLPDQLTPAEQARALYADTGRLVENPLAEIEAEHHMRPWAWDEEVRLEQALLACITDPESKQKKEDQELRLKDFRKCAAAVGTRSVQECVKRYYQRGTLRPANSRMPLLDRLESKRKKPAGRHAAEEESGAEEDSGGVGGGSVPRAGPVLGSPSQAQVRRNPSRVRSKAMVRSQSTPQQVGGANAGDFREAFLEAWAEHGEDYYLVARELNCGVRTVRRFAADNDALLKAEVPTRRRRLATARAAAGALRSAASLGSQTRGDGGVRSAVAFAASGNVLTPRASIAPPLLRSHTVPNQPTGAVTSWPGLPGFEGASQQHRVPPMQLGVAPDVAAVRGDPVGVPQLRTGAEDSGPGALLSHLTKTEGPRCDALFPAVQAHIVVGPETNGAALNSQLGRSAASMGLNVGPVQPMQLDANGDVLESQVPLPAGDWSAQLGALGWAPSALGAAVAEVPAPFPTPDADPSMMQQCQPHELNRAADVAAVVEETPRYLHDLQDHESTDQMTF